MDSNSRRSLEELSLEAKREIGEVDENIPQQLEDLKEILEKNYTDLKLPPNPEELLLRFLRARKFDIPRAAKQCSDYFKVIHQMRGIHHLFSPKSVEWTYRDCVVNVLPQRDSRGRMVVHGRHEFIPPTSDWFDVAVTSLFLMIDFVNKMSVDTQRIGVHFLFDMKGHNFGHIRYINPFRVIQASKLITGAIPARVTGMHFVRNPEAFTYLFSLAKPFFPKKIKSRTYFHGYNFESLHKHIEPEILPDYYGGKVAESECVDFDVLSKHLEDEYMEELLKYGYS